MKEKSNLLVLESKLENVDPMTAVFSIEFSKQQRKVGVDG